jgi:hypothetical protein
MSVIHAPATVVAITLRLIRGEGGCTTCDERGSTEKENDGSIQFARNRRKHAGKETYAGGGLGAGWLCARAFLYTSGISQELCFVSVLYQYFLPPSAVYSFHGWFAKARYQEGQFLTAENNPTEFRGGLTSTGVMSSKGLCHCVALVWTL